MILRSLQYRKAHIYIACLSGVQAKNKILTNELACLKSWNTYITKCNCPSCSRNGRLEDNMSSFFEVWEMQPSKKKTKEGHQCFVVFHWISTCSWRRPERINLHSMLTWVGNYKWSLTGWDLLASCMARRERCRHIHLGLRLGIDCQNIRSLVSGINSW